MNLLTKKLQQSKTFFIVWAMIAGFGAYFSMYAFRKPFNNGTYSGLYLWGLDYKVVIIETYYPKQFLIAMMCSNISTASTKVSTSNLPVNW